MRSPAAPVGPVNIEERIDETDRRIQRRRTLPVLLQRGMHLDVSRIFRRNPVKILMTQEPAPAPACRKVDHEHKTIRIRRLP